MWIADQWKDYEVIDCSKGEKLERWGNYILVRPDPRGYLGHPRKDPGGREKTDIITAAKKAAANGNFLSARRMADPL